MVTMNKPADGAPNWYRAVTDNWTSIEKNLLDKNIPAGKGELFVATTYETVSSVPVGADATLLIADSTQGVGMRYASINGTGYSPVQSVRATTSTNTTSTTYVDLDSMTLSVTAGAASKVLVMFNANILGGANYATLCLLRDSTALQTIVMGSKPVGWTLSSNVFALDQPGAGTFTYKIQWKVDIYGVTQDLEPYSMLGDRLLVAIVLPG